MVERFAGRARRVVVLAQEEARMLNCHCIGAAHILLGLIREGAGAAAKALESLGIALESPRRRVEEIIGQGRRAPSGHIPFTPRVKKVLASFLFGEFDAGRIVAVDVEGWSGDPDDRDDEANLVFRAAGLPR